MLPIDGNLIRNSHIQTRVLSVLFCCGMKIKRLLIKFYQLYCDRFSNPPYAARPLTWFGIWYALKIMENELASLNLWLEYDLCWSIMVTWLLCLRSVHLLDLWADFCPSCLHGHIHPSYLRRKTAGIISTYCSDTHVYTPSLRVWKRSASVWIFCEALVHSMQLQTDGHGCLLDNMDQ